MFSHWQRLGLFRKRHPSVGSGVHQQVLESPYAFRRATDDDVVYAAIGAVGAITLNVAQDWEDGAIIRDGYTGEKAVVESGQVTFTVADAGVLLLERSPE